MSDTGLFNSRFSTPVDELDDHRLQPETLPRADTMEGGRSRPGRRNTAGSIVSVLQPPVLQVNGTSPDGITSIDFENAIEDDDRSEIDEGQASTSPVHGRRGTFRRSERPSRSRESNEADGSPSPPNSVDAFAEAARHRPRAGTVGTVGTANSFNPAHSLHKTPSTSTFARARKFSLGPERDQTVDSDDTSDQGSVEDDVCFPPSEHGDDQPHGIDYDDLNEFVAEQQAQTPVPGLLRRKHSFSCISNKKLGTAGKKDVQARERLSISKPRIPESESQDSSVIDEKIDLDIYPEKVDPVYRWSFFSSELEDSIHAPELGDLLMPGETFQHLFESTPDGGCWWLDILMPSEDEVEVICKAFGIHGLTREDIIQQETREKVELFKYYYFVCFRSFSQMDQKSDDFLEPVNVYAVVFRGGVLTFTFSPSPHAANVRKRMGRLRDYLSLGSDWICYALIDDIVDSFGPVISDVQNETDTIEDTVFTARPEDSRILFRQISDCRKKVMSLSRLIGGKADVIKGFAKRCNEQYSMAPRRDVGLYLSDIQDHVVTMMSNLAHYDHILSRSHANYLAQISVDNTTQGNRANEALGKVTFIATVLVPMNLVCGMFGMNVPVPGHDSTGLEWFFGILGCLLFFVFCAFLFAKRFRYL